MPSEERQRDGRSQTQTVRDWRATKDKSEAREETVELQNPPLSAIKIDGAIKHRLFLYARKIWTPAGGSEDVGQSEVVRRKALKTGLSQKILMQTQLIS